MVHRSSFPPVPCTPYSSYNCLPLTRRDLAYTYSCCRWAVQKHRWKYNLFHCFKPHVVVLAHLDNSVASWRWVLWPFVPWPFVSVAFCLVAFCLWPYVRWSFVPWPFVCTPRSSVHRIIHRDLQYKCFKRCRVQLLSEANRISHLIRW